MKSLLDAGCSVLSKLSMRLRRIIKQYEGCYFGSTLQDYNLKECCVEMNGEVSRAIDCIVYFCGV